MQICGSFPPFSYSSLTWSALFMISRKTSLLIAPACIPSNRKATQNFVTESVHMPVLLSNIYLPVIIRLKVLEWLPLPQHHFQMSKFSSISTYITYLSLPLCLMCLPWILARIVAAASCCGSSDRQLVLLPWPRRGVPVLLALPLGPLGHLCMALSSRHYGVHTEFHFFRSITNILNQ